MPILAVTLGADDSATASQAADNKTAELKSAVGVPMVSEAMRAEIMQLIWANFEVRNSRFQVGFKCLKSSSKMKREEKTALFGVNSIRSQVLYRAA